MTDETVSVICFFCYGKLLFCNVRNAPRGCALRRTRQMSQAIYVSLRPLLNKRHWRENVPWQGKSFRNEFCLTYRKVLSDKMQYINMQKRQI